MNPRPPPRLRLVHVVAGAVALTVAVVTGLGWLFLSESRHAIDRRAAELRLQSAARVEALIDAHLGHAETALLRTAEAMNMGALHIDDDVDVESRLFTEVAQDPLLDAATFTRSALQPGQNDDELSLLVAPRWQVSVYRTGPSVGAPIWTLRVRQAADGHLVQDLRQRPPMAPLLVPYSPATPTDIDPTDALTFRTPATPALQTRTLWSDLHYVDVDSGL